MPSSVILEALGALFFLLEQSVFFFFFPLNFLYSLQVGVTLVCAAAAIFSVVLRLLSFNMLAFN